ncbi:4774_t:CDS:2, partial [Dentiscutata heterogama]
RKPQCIIATASTTAADDEVERVVKERNNSSLVKFTRPKIFSEYSASKGAVDINNQIRDNMTSFHDVMRGSDWEIRVLAFLLRIAEANAFISFKKWRRGAHDTSHFDFRRQLAFEILNMDYLDIRNSTRKTSLKEPTGPLHKILPIPKRKKTRNITIYPQLRCMYCGTRT